VVACRWRALAWVRAVRQDTEIVLLDTKHWHYYGLQGAAAIVWDLLLDKPRTKEELVEELMQVYTNPRADLGDFVGYTLEQLVENQLIESDEGI